MEAVDMNTMPTGSAQVDRVGDMIAQCKSILQLVDAYTDHRTAANRTSLRVALMECFDARSIADGEKFHCPGVSSIDGSVVLHVADDYSDADPLTGARTFTVNGLDAFAQVIYQRGAGVAQDLQAFAVLSSESKPFSCDGAHGLDAGPQCTIGLDPSSAAGVEALLDRWLAAGDGAMAPLVSRNRLRQAIDEWGYHERHNARIDGHRAAHIQCEKILQSVRSRMTQQRDLVPDDAQLLELAEPWRDCGGNYSFSPAALTRYVGAALTLARFTWPAAPVRYAPGSDRGTNEVSRHYGPIEYRRAQLEWGSAHIPFVLQSIPGCPPTGPGTLMQLGQTIDLLLEHDRKGYSLTGLLQVAKKLLDPACRSSQDRLRDAAGAWYYECSDPAVDHGIWQPCLPFEPPSKAKCIRGVRPMVFADRASADALLGGAWATANDLDCCGLVGPFASDAGTEASAVHAYQESKAVVYRAARFTEQSRARLLQVPRGSLRIAYSGLAYDPDHRCHETLYAVYADEVGDGLIGHFFARCLTEFVL